MTKPFNLFIPITKVDAAKRLVYGVATAELPDRTGEICDYETTKPYYEKWSGDIAKATDGKSVGNLRSMHGNVAAGKLTDIAFDDVNKRVEICAKVVDDAEWQKVEEGVYTGFSQGGAYVKRWKDPENPDLTRYTAEPIEVSLVDLPCLPEATFEMIKAGGETEMRKFKSVEKPADAPAISNADVAKRATELAEAAGKAGEWTAFIETARAELEKAAAPAPEVAADSAVAQGEAEDKPTNFDPEVEQVWKALDGTTHAKKADALKASALHREKEAKAALDKAAQAAAAPVNELLSQISAVLDERDGKPAKEAEAAPVATEAVPVEPVAKSPRVLSIRALTKADKAGRAKAVAKGLYDVARLASLIAELDWLTESVAFEAEIEQDGSTMPATLKDSVAALCAALRAMVEEETAELVDDGDIEVFEMAAGHVPHALYGSLLKMADKLGDKAKAAVEKAGARHSKADKARINAAHDLLVDAGADCGSADKAAHAGELAKVTGERDAVQKALDGLTPVLKDILDRVKNIEAQPLQQGQPTVFKLVGKGEEEAEITAEKLAAMTPEQIALLALKAAQRQGKPLSERGR